MELQAIQWIVSITQSKVATRLFADGDLRTLYAMEEACFAPPLRYSRGLIRSLTRDPECRTWVGIIDGVRAGFAVVALRGQEDSSCAYIWTIEVLPAFRRRGVARRLLARLEESAREAACAAIELHVSERNLDAVALYEAVGYERFGRDTGFYGIGEDGLRYRKGIPVL